MARGRGGRQGERAGATRPVIGRRQRPVEAVAAWAVASGGGTCMLADADAPIKILNISE